MFVLVVFVNPCGLINTVMRPNAVSGL